MFASLVLALAMAVLPTCATEDSSACGWDASTQGNGTGRSFVEFAGEVWYL